MQHTTPATLYFFPAFRCLLFFGLEVAVVVEDATAVVPLTVVPASDCASFLGVAPGCGCFLFASFGGGLWRRRITMLAIPPEAIMRRKRGTRLMTLKTCIIASA